MPSIDKHVTRELLALDGSATSRDAARLMEERRIGALGVRENGKVIGLVTERDLAIQVLGRGLTGEVPIREAMRRDVPSISPRASETDCSNIMRDHATRHLLVEDAGQV